MKLQEFQMGQNGEGMWESGWFGQRYMKNGLGHIINGTECHTKESGLYSVWNGTIKVFEKVCVFILE